MPRDETTQLLRSSKAAYRPSHVTTREKASSLKQIDQMSVSTYLHESQVPRIGVSLKRMLGIMMLVIVVLMAVLAFCIERLGAASDAVAQAHQVRYTSYLLADELRQSSDDLTRLARTYVVDGHSKWKDQYQEVLDIRSGKHPRPAEYHKIYWDFRAADMQPARGQEPAASLTDLMKRAGFSKEEFAKLEEAERNSNDLVRTETEAMSMVGSAVTSDRATAQLLMHDSNYHQFKSKIMRPLDDFFAAVDQRTQKSIDVAENNRAFWLFALACVAIATTFVLAVCLWFAYRSLAKSLKEAVRVSDSIAAGNLDLDVDVGGPHEVASLLRAMSTMRIQLVNVVGNVRQNADAVATACSHIAQGNSDLSVRTEEQASALQETSASMEQLSATVQRNADSAAQADRLSRGAQVIATRGGEMVSRVVDTMKGITESSKKISDIIGVIDGISFQTNLLALNAAVEAARAGEQGRGFAVVASEVRQLAQRSAEASKQIRELILDSVTRVEQGTTIVDRAGLTMNQLVEAIVRVTAIMGEITVASSEQSAGVSQVGRAIAQMDEATQQNAALVEESAAAAEMLRDQSRQLVTTVDAFKLASDRSSSAAPGHGVRYASSVPNTSHSARLDVAA
jgi:methyl-accepting chemotaxis protein